ncbi:hypothetical protein EJ03DRAFT_269657 [Teratosphaeria nubilosa]|uniref:DAGKc domain-containing protein n=1 Tax=Teratosphaeria nubilosa TaxID=161662 RepID=A0A6G1LEX3_9PEZI|nr:hypothetical protein EJ03DRAFT_269657 [Teratosphaeria nubilosa]
MDPANTEHNTDPFQDPAGSEVTTAGTSELLDTPAVLAVDRNATLTLGTDALIVLDDGLRHRRSARNCCGLLPSLSKTTRAIPFYNVLWAELQDFEVSIQYAQPSGKKACRVGSVHYTVTDKSLHAHTKQWVQALMERAYPANVKRLKRMKVLINPFGGQGNAQKLWTTQMEPIIAAARCAVDVEKTTHRGHAVEIAEALDVDAYDVVACASGDGTPHEVFNGLAKQKEPRRALRKVAVALLPCGSGNAMSLNLNGTDSPSLAAVGIVKGVRTPLDLMAVTQGKQRYYSFLSQAVGIIAESDLGTESLRWMGSFRFTWGILVRMLGKTTYPAEVSVVAETSDKHAIRESYCNTVSELEAAAAKQIHDIDSAQETSETDLPPLKYGTVLDPLPPAFETQDMPTLGNFYVGNMYWMSPDAAFFAAALPSDGRADMMNIDAMIPKSTILRMLMSVENGTLIDFPETLYRKVLAYRITPRMAPKEGLIAVDGERVPFEAFQVEVLGGLGTVLSKRGPLFEFEKNPLLR